MGTATREISGAKPSWTTVFGRSRITPVAFTVRPKFVDRVNAALDDLGMPTSTWSRMYSPLYRSRPLLDGLVITLEGYGFPAGYLPSGMRVIGYPPLRALCLLLDLASPSRRLKGEDRIPADEELREELRVQQGLPPDELEARAEIGFVTDRVGLLLLVRKLYGDRWLPADPDPALERALPADGEWGAAGFSRGEQRQLEAAGISLDFAAPLKQSRFTTRDIQTLTSAGITTAEALQWLRLGVHTGAPDDTPLPHLMAELHQYGFRQTQPWFEARVTPRTIAFALRRGLTLPIFLKYRAAGWSDRVIEAFVSGGLNPQASRDYAHSSLSDYQVLGFAEAGLTVAEAQKWTELGFDAQQTAKILRNEHTWSDAELLIDQGNSPYTAAQRLTATHGPVQVHHGT